MKRIVIKGTNWIGDVFLSLPAVYSLRHLFPKAEIAIALKWPLGDLVRGIGIIDTVHDYEGTMNGEKKLIGQLRKKRYDLGVCFPRSLHAALLIFFGGARERLGYAADLRSAFLTTRVTRTQAVKSLHQSEYYRHLISVLGDPGPLVIPRLLLSDDEKAWAERFLKREGYRGGTLVGINPGAAYGDAKRWYPDRFAAVADALARRHDAEIIIFGGPADRAAAEEVSRHMKSPHVFAAARTTLRELISLIARCILFITNDTGPMHIAAAVDVPILAVFGPTNPITTSPMGIFEMVRHDVDCSPCLERSCPAGHHRCMELVKESEVIERAEKFLLSKGKKISGDKTM
jgi:heptosyltransferase-2